MKKRLLLPLALLISLISFAQSTDLDKETLTVSYVKLPSEPILDDTKRTYSSSSSSIRISGFSKVKSPGTLDISYRFNGTKSSEVNIEKITHEKKDDDGNVVSTTYTYKAKSSISSSATINVINAANGESYEKGFSDSNSYESKEFDSYYKAERHYKTNKYDIRSSHGSKHKGNIKRSIRSYLDRRYGYVPYTTSSEFLWILGSKKHPEFQKHHEAHEKVKAAFAKMKYDEPLDDVKKEVEPVIEYFNSIIPNYPGTKRKMRKVKYASYYNIANIYYYLDMPEKVKEYAQKLIENDYDKKDGKKYIKYADNLIKTLEVNKMKTRHMKVLTEDLSNIPDEEEEVEEKPAAAPAGIEVNQAYLITKKGDTTLVDIKTEDIVKIGFDLKTVEYDNNKSPIGTRVQAAKNCQELLFVDGLHYRNIKFKESALKGDAVDAGQMLAGATDKLCKVLFESDKINLYIFNNKELVILPTGAEKGKSTMGTSFVFGFKKNLAKFAEGCPAVIEKAKSKGYKNTKESLLEYCQELTKCEVK
ncbi:hypothetical protein D1816_21650 [Aquimarina sp. AD10]|uniref:Uncharacterized protein n=1 Tax=Aquimarina aggregata TaxID=1642818 RepID=A0A163CTK0_9FLAO|nr:MULTISPECIES: hypothetical protein [Aquimarina]AXT62836.1 hypothetical protein D1816_21650 [Aquimarina sp. AD10]KZS42753.1 hypothetical protein AWE51_15380 [Aquimarina aggregata]RKN02020.1 hypothetical protein D7033_03015 [Aquimarina sp. AD10]